MGVKINISTKGDKCSAGDVVQGIVHLDVSSKGSEGSSANELVLRLIGRAKTCVMHNTTATIHNGTNPQTVTHREAITQSREFLSYDVQLASFGGRAAAGTHAFPFSVMLPPGLPPSMKETGPNGGNCAIVYGFEAKLHRPGILKFDAKGKAQLTVLGKPQEVPAPAAGKPVPAAVPVLVGPATQKVKKCCCFGSGSMSVGFEASRSVVGRNEKVGLNVVARNDSSASVKAMHIEVEQVTTWFARGYKESQARTVASLVVSASQLGELQRGAAAEGNARGRSVAEVEDAARKDLQELLTAGAGTRYEIRVPEDCLLTLRTDIIEVGHSVGVRLKTATCVSSPEVSTPLVVHQEAVDADAEVEEFNPSPMQAVPFATGMEVDDDGNYLPVVVPQTAVKMEYSDGVVQPSAPAKFEA